MVPEAMWPAHKVDPGHEGGREKKIAISDGTLPAHKVDLRHEGGRKRRELSVMRPWQPIKLTLVIRISKCGQLILLTFSMLEPPNVASP